MTSTNVHFENESITDDNQYIMIYVPSKITLILNYVYSQRVWYVQYCQMLPHLFVNSIDIFVHYK